ncbi:MAG: arylsulfatase [Gemmataceae bacterium]|nr:arylsulfatase [Gemmataceae bacterium]
MFRWLTVLAVFLLAAVPAQASQKKLPNIVLILADDLGIGDLGCYNKKSKIPTPHIDRLAKQGMRFLDAHTPSSVCTPTRYALMTGRYAWRTPLKKGVLQGYDPLLIEDSRMTLASLLRRHGYTTGCVGKWHLGLGKDGKTDYSKKFNAGPTTVGFDYFFGIPSSLDFPPYVFVENDRAVEEPTKQIAASKSRREGGEGFWRAGAIAPSFKHRDVLPKLTEKAVGFIQKQAKESAGKPFFLYFALSGPHTPWLPTDKYLGKSKAGFYGDFVVQVDDTIGAVLDALDRLKLADDTLVIVTSDNGAHWTPEDIERFMHLANLFYRGQKADIWEAGHRVAFIARWPGRIRPGSTSEQTICLCDLLATCASIVGEKLPEKAGEDSYNLLPVLLGTHKGGAIRDATIHHSGSGMFAIRQGDWVFIDGLGSGGFSLPRTEKAKPGGPTGQLYNLARDPRQQDNVFAKHPEIVARMREALNQIRASGRSRPR